MSSFSCPVPPLQLHRVNGWPQPDPKKFSWNIADHEVTISEQAFNELHEYSTTTPTGVYPGKMWKSQNPHDESWYLRFFGLVYKDDGDEDTSKCSNHAYKLFVEVSQ